MKKTLVFLCALLSCAAAFGDDAAAPFYADSNAVSVSIGGPIAIGLYPAAPWIPGLYGFNFGYQRIFRRFGIGASFKTLTFLLPDEAEHDYPMDWSEDGYFNLQYVHLGLKPIVVLNDAADDAAFDFVFYLFGSIVFRDVFVKGHEGFSLAEFLPYSGGLGIGSEVNFLNRVSFFCEASYCLGDGVMDDPDAAEYKPERFDHYMLSVLVGMLPRLELGFKYYF